MRAGAARQGLGTTEHVYLPRFSTIGGRRACLAPPCMPGQQLPMAGRPCSGSQRLHTARLSVASEAAEGASVLRHTQHQQNTGRSAAGQGRLTLQQLLGLCSSIQELQEVIQAHRDRMDAADLIAAHHAACACMLGDSNSPLAAWADNWQRGGIHQRRLHNQPKQPTSSQLPLQLASQLADLASSHAPHMAFDDLYCLVQAQRDVLEAVQARCGQPGFMPMHRDSHGSSSASHVSQGSHGQQHMHQGLPESPQHALLQLAHASLSACLPSPTAALHLGVEEVLTHVTSVQQSLAWLASSPSSSSDAAASPASPMRAQPGAAHHIPSAAASRDAAEALALACMQRMALAWGLPGGRLHGVRGDMGAQEKEDALASLCVAVTALAGLDQVLQQGRASGKRARSLLQRPEHEAAWGQLCAGLTSLLAHHFSGKGSTSPCGPVFSQALSVLPVLQTLSPQAPVAAVQAYLQRLEQAVHEDAAILTPSQIAALGEVIDMHEEQAEEQALAHAAEHAGHGLSQPEASGDDGLEDEGEEGSSSLGLRVLLQCEAAMVTHGMCEALRVGQQDSLGWQDLADGLVEVLQELQEMGVRLPPKAHARAQQLLLTQEVHLSDEQVWQLMVGLKALRPEGHSSDSSSTSSTSQGVTAAVPAPLLTAFLKEAKAAQRGQHGNEEGGEDEESEEEARARVAEAAQWEAVGSRVAQYLASLPPEEQRGAAAQLMGL